MGVVLNGELRCRTAEEATRVRAALPEHIRLSRDEPGCLRFEVAPTADELVWSVSEEFTDAAAFEAHQNRTAASDWARETQGIARHYEVTGLDPKEK